MHKKQLICGNKEVKVFYKTSQEEFDYDMIYVTQFYDGKLWVVWSEVATGKSVTSEFEEIGYKPEFPATE